MQATIHHLQLRLLLGYFISIAKSELDCNPINDDSTSCWSGLTLLKVSQLADDKQWKIHQYPTTIIFLGDRC